MARETITELREENSRLYAKVASLRDELADAEDADDSDSDDSDESDEGDAS
jgi:hypothetical protein